METAIEPGVSPFQGFHGRLIFRDHVKVLGNSLLKATSEFLFIGGLHILAITHVCIAVRWIDAHILNYNVSINILASRL